MMAAPKASPMPPDLREVLSGIPFIRQAVADFITRRDGVAADREHVILTDGASGGVKLTIVSLLKHPHDGILVPTPQYPLYSAEIALRGGRRIDYYLDEAHDWQLSEAALTDAIVRARRDGAGALARPSDILLCAPSAAVGRAAGARARRRLAPAHRAHQPRAERGRGGTRGRHGSDPDMGQGRCGVGFSRGKDEDAL